MIICVEGDATTPEDHAVRAVRARPAARSGSSSRRGTTHYAAYAQYRDVVNPLIVEWFERHLVGGEVLVHERPAAAEILT